MKLSRFLTQSYVWILWLVLVAIVVHAPLSVWLTSQFPTYELALKSWKEIAMILLLPVGVYLATRKALWKEMKHDRLLQLLSLFVLVHLVMAIVRPLGLEPMVAGLFIDLRFSVLFLLLYVAVRTVPRMRWWYTAGSVAMASLSMLFSLLQVVLLPDDILAAIGYGKGTISPYLTVDNNPSLVRINGTFRGPNSVGAYGAMVLSTVVAFILRKKYWFLWTGIFVPVLAYCALLSVWNSYSRSALIAATVGVMVVLAATYIRRLPLKMWFIILVGTILVGVSGFFALQNTEFVTRVILHDDPNTGAEVSSNEAHVESLQSGLRNLVVQPFGEGVGSTGSASLHGSKFFVVENYYLFVAREAGWLGLGVFVAVVAMVLQRLWKARSDWLALGLFASGIGLAVVAIFLPIWADDTISMVWWGLAAVALASHRK